MLFNVVAVLLAIIAGLAALLALRLLVGRWLLGWLRGTAGIALTVLAVTIAVGAWDLRGYRPLSAAEPIGTISFKQLGAQHFAATLTGADGVERRYELHGDMWQIDARLLRWADALTRLGLQPGYRLDRLGGRYLSLEDEQSRPRSVIGLAETRPAFDIWAWLRRSGNTLGLLAADYGSATYLPMADGALYQVGLGGDGLVAVPLNDPARGAVAGWE
jgi:hypothetical protein